MLLIWIIAYSLFLKYCILASVILIWQNPYYYSVGQYFTASPAIIPVLGRIAIDKFLTVSGASLTSAFPIDTVKSVAHSFADGHSANEWIKKLWYIYTVEFYAAERNKELIPFATAWMKLESIMLSEISQMVRDKYHMISPLTGT